MTIEKPIEKNNQEPIKLIDLENFAIKPPFGIKTVSFGFLKNLLLLSVILGLPEIIVQRSDR